MIPCLNGRTDRNGNPGRSGDALACGKASRGGHRRGKVEIKKMWQTVHARYSACAMNCLSSSSKATGSRC